MSLASPLPLPSLAASLRGTLDASASTRKLYATDASALVKPAGRRKLPSNAVDVGTI